MGRPAFDNAQFLTAARELAIERGPAAVTVDLVLRRLKAPKGSFYHRFGSRDALLGELWLKSALAYQQGFIAAIDAGDGVGAALHAPAWARQHLDDACLLLLYSREDFISGNWPAALQEAVRDQAARVADGLKRFARQTFSGTGPLQMRRAAFVLLDVPLAAVKPHLKRREIPPPLVDELIRRTFDAIVTGMADVESG